MLGEYIEKLSSDGELYLSIKVIPSAGKTLILDKMADGVLKIALKAVAEKGKANNELIKFLSKELSINKDSIQIIGGKTARLKLVKIKVS